VPSEQGKVASHLRGRECSVTSERYERTGGISRSPHHTSLVCAVYPPHHISLHPTQPCLSSLFILIQLTIAAIFDCHLYSYAGEREEVKKEVVQAIPVR
jgi:hypothetical protein